MIDKLSDQEKSVMLARVMGLEIVPPPTDDSAEMFVIPPEWDWEWDWHDDFYDPASMALAWRVLNWALANEAIGQPMVYWLESIKTRTDDELTRHAPVWWLIMSVNNTAAWLDKILTLAIEAGIVDTSVNGASTAQGR